jgi:hypothetical protein
VVVAFKTGNLTGFQGIGGVEFEFLTLDTEDRAQLGDVSYFEEHFVGDAGGCRIDGFEDVAFVGALIHDGKRYLRA